LIDAKPKFGVSTDVMFSGSLSASVSFANTSMFNRGVPTEVVTKSSTATGDVLTIVTLTEASLLVELVSNWSALIIVAVLLKKSLGVILKTLLEFNPATKTLPNESVATSGGKVSAFPNPSPVLSMISVMVPPGVILKALLEFRPTTKTLPDESAATLNGPASTFPSPSPVLSMI